MHAVRRHKSSGRGATFDAGTAFYSITHVPRDEHGALLRSIAGWLKPGGRFLASFGVTPLNGWQDDWLGTTMFFSHHGADETRRLVLDAGLLLEREMCSNRTTRTRSFFGSQPRKP
jgi:SAM-dependent methyltransferase